jgi:hypothetical protein
MSTIGHPVMSNHGSMAYYSWSSSNVNTTLYDYKHPSSSGNSENRILQVGKTTVPQLAFSRG